MFDHPVLRRYYQRYGPAPFLPHPVPQREPFRVLAESIVAQQLSSRAAATLTARLWSLVEPRPGALLKVAPASLRQAGLSQAKALALLDLAAKAEEGLLEGLEDLEDGAVKERLQRVRGVGPWTAEMFLMFGLGRPDVAGARFGVEAEALPAFGEPFRPYRSHLAWYLWRTLD
ncbi:DNA-3-methyladenine glycosylase family protein [Thermus caliditerrae]|uniref:DNA-3-methyladenine glycosylase family protein n=1 Tax=Thermus caliditerrae TaxID=1330700 RepID=UPI001F1EA19B|nr:DNA-3-methyladenine glycosylase 2 family protein [Thermus caliditerrae]